MKFANDTKLEGVTKKKKRQGFNTKEPKSWGKANGGPSPPPKKKQIKTYKNIRWKKFNLRKK